MQMEEKIIGMLEQIMSKQDDHSEILNGHSEMLNEHSKILNEHSKILNEHSNILNEHSKILGEHTQKLDNHDSQLKDHGQVLSAILTGQEYLKAEIDGMKVSNANEFGAIKGRMDDFFANFEVLRDETWKNKTDIQRIKNVMGMN
ncbi:hypothetical protein [Virgibacillus oceani]|uniref:Uncharacterized protein n=1 Tax=Virgibacillus oceani TaxID=1479511 RepID=A0A917M296_9BACI|nr:hypothetical protein [Virgibacillus oceani]GGG74606.1 hypothetical protein GCM10011398_19120 [Virgibacillus oceani]